MCKCEINFRPTLLGYVFLNINVDYIYIYICICVPVMPDWDFSGKNTGKSESESCLWAISDSVTPWTATVHGIL